MMKAVMNNNGPDDAYFLNDVNYSGWLTHLVTILNAAQRAAKVVSDGNSILIHCRQVGLE